MKRRVSLPVSFTIGLLTITLAVPVAFAAPHPSSTTPPASSVRSTTIPTQPGASSPGSVPSWNIQAVTAPASAGPLLAEAQRIYKTMKRTKYTHKYVINAKTGIYFWDCVGFTNWAMKSATPNAYQAFHTAMNVSTKDSGHVALWAEFLTGTPGPAWSVVNSVTSLTGGELMIIPGEIVLDGQVQYGSTSNGQSYVGHAVIIAGPALRLADGSYAVATYDATSLPGHGQNDSRYTDARALPLTTSQPTKFSGTGFGNMRFTVNAKGAPTAIYWSPNAKQPIMFDNQPIVPVLARPLN